MSAVSSDFGDKDPEDAYDAGDLPAVRLRVLSRIVAALRDPAARNRENRVQDARRLIDDFARELDDYRDHLDLLSAELDAS